MVSIIVLALGGYIVYAQTTNTYPPIAQKLAKRFNLDAAKVNKVFKEQREEIHKERMARFEERLDKAVAAGKITETQKEATLAKKDELKEKHHELISLSPEKRRQSFKELREDLEKWAEENKIDLRLFLDHGEGRGRSHF